MSLFGGSSLSWGGLGRGVGKVWSGVAKPVIGGLISQYAGQGAGNLWSKWTSTKTERGAARGDSTLWSQISPSLAPIFERGSTASMQDPGVMAAQQWNNPIRTQGLTSPAPEPQWEESEWDEYEEEEDDYEYGY